MGAEEPVEEKEREEKEVGVEQDGVKGGDGEDIEKGEVGYVNREEENSRTSIDNNDTNYQVQGQSGQNTRDYHAAMLRTLNPTNPLRIVINSNTRAATPSPPPPPHPLRHPQPHPQAHHHHSQSHPPSVSRSTPTPQNSIATLNSRNYTNRFYLFLFMLHMVVAIGLVGFLVFKGVQGLIDSSDSIKRKEKRVLIHFLPQVEVAAFLSITLAFAWQKAVRVWPQLMVHIILWTSFLMSLSAGILLLCFQTPPTDGVGICLVAFAVGNGLYSCWITQRIKFCCEVLLKALEPVSKFPDINWPIYWMLGAGFLWMFLWILAVIGALNFYFPPLIIIALVLSLAWTTEVMRNIANITVSRVISLYYLRGMQSSTYFCFQRALSLNLGSACLGSLFVPTIEALRVLARGLNLLEGEDEFMFSCAHCCLHVMESIFRHGNGWAFVQIAAYGKGFVRASQDTWELFEKQQMVPIVDSDITSSICFLTGVCSGSICVIVVAAWTYTVHKPFVATISLLSFFIGYLMTRIAMAVPYACVSCYYVCYAENPQNRLFDQTIKDRQEKIRTGRDAVMPTPRMAARLRRA